MSAPAPLDTAARASAAVQKFLVDLDHPEMRVIEVQVAAVNGLRPFWPFLPKEAQAAVIAKLTKLTGRPTEWVRRLFDLSEMEVRRALRSRPPRLDRHGHETLYPNDGWLGAYLLYAQDSEAPLGWHFWCAVAVLGMAARRNFYWDRGRYILYQNHYLLLIGETGLKKSTSIDQAVDVLKLAARKAVDSGMPGDQDPFFFSPDQVTPEFLDASLAAWTKEHPKAKDTIAAIINDEAVTLLGDSVWGSDRIITFLTKVYMGREKETFGSVGRGQRTITNLQVTGLFGSAPDWIRDSVTDTMLTGGFIGRCIMAPRHEPHAIFPEPLPNDPVVKHVLAEQLVPWILLDGLVECRRTRDATQWYEEWYAAHRGKQPADPRMLGWWNRKDDHLHKLAGVLRLSELIGSGQGALTQVQRERVMYVDTDVFKWAAEILNDEESRLPKLIAMVGASTQSRHNDKLYAIVEEYYRTEKRPIPHSLLMRKCDHFIGDARDFGRAMDTLEQQERVVRLVSRVKGLARHTYLPKWAETPPSEEERGNE